MKALVIARVNVIRTLRDRMGLFFIVILPLILITVLGLTYGGMNTARVGVADLDGGTLAGDVVRGIRTTEIHIQIRRYDTPGELRDAVTRGFVEVGLVIPAGYDATLRSGGTASIEVVAQAQSVASAVRTAVDESIAAQTALIQATRFTMRQTGRSFDQALAAAKASDASTNRVAVSVEQLVSGSSNPSGFSQGAQSQVILFMFLTSMTGAVALVSTRQLGISRREFSTPTGVGTIVVGEALGRFAFALFQGGFIVIASALLFGVAWGDPAAITAIVVVFGLVSAGAAMLVASAVTNEHQVAAVGPALGMLFGLLGGTMVPIEVFPSVMRTLSHATPQAWAMEAFRVLNAKGGGLLGILPDLAVLAAFAIVLMALASFRLRRSIVSGGV